MKITKKLVLSLEKLTEDERQEFWFSRTPEERCSAIAIYNRLKYGDKACAARMDKTFYEVVSIHDSEDS